MNGESETNSMEYQIAGGNKKQDVLVDWEDETREELVVTGELQPRRARKDLLRAISTHDDSCSGDGSSNPEVCI